MSLPSEGYVDPLDAAQVTPVLDAVLEMAGLGGLADLLDRIPGLRVQPAVPGRLFRAAAPPAAWFGAENCLSLADPVMHQQVVGGVVLHRAQVGRGALAPLIARLLAPVVRESGGQEEAAVALTAAREAFSGL